MATYQALRVQLSNSKNGSESREPIALLLSYINEDFEGNVYGLIGENGETLNYKSFMTKVQVKDVFEKGIIKIDDNNEKYVYVTSIDKDITTNARKKALTNDGFNKQLLMINKILGAILNSTKLN